MRTLKAASLVLALMLGCDDSPDTVVDGGAAPEDSGAPPADAGVDALDAANPVDANLAPEDAHVVTPEARLRAELVWGVGGEGSSAAYDVETDDGVRRAEGYGSEHFAVGMEPTTAAGNVTFGGWGSTESFRWHRWNWEDRGHLATGVPRARWARSDEGLLVLFVDGGRFDDLELPSPSLIWVTVEGDRTTLALPAGTDVEYIQFGSGDTFWLRGESSGLSEMGVTPRGAASGRFLAEVSPRGFSWVTGLGRTWGYDAVFASDGSAWLEWKQNEDLLGEAPPFDAWRALVHVDGENARVLGSWANIGRRSTWIGTTDDGDIRAQLSFDLGAGEDVVTFGGQEYTAPPASSAAVVELVWDGLASPPRGSILPGWVSGGWWQGTAVATGFDAERLIGRSRNAVLARFGEDDRADWVLTASPDYLPVRSSGSNPDLWIVSHLLEEGVFNHIGEVSPSPTPPGRRDLYVALYDTTGARVRDLRLEDDGEVWSYVVDADEDHLLVYRYRRDDPMDFLGREHVIEQRRWDGSLVATIPIAWTGSNCIGLGANPYATRTQRDAAGWASSRLQILSNCRGPHTLQVGEVSHSYGTPQSTTFLDLHLLR
ncbi:MAG: hypothetical protein R3B99_31425 [Polyangiales bacterium]